MAYDILDCEECDQSQPIAHLIRMSRPRGQKLSKHRLDMAECLELEPNDVLAAYCSRCGRPVQVELRVWREDQKQTKTAKV